MSDQPAAKFTPGPWIIRKAKWQNDGAFDFAVGATIGGHDYCIAEAFGRVARDILTPAEANAHLIAAAPDLFLAILYSDDAHWTPAMRAALIKATQE